VYCCVKAIKPREVTHRILRRWVPCHRALERLGLFSNEFDCMNRVRTERTYER